MSVKLEQVSVEVIKAMLDNLGRAKHFVLEQAPDVMREIVLLGRITSTASLAVALVFLSLWAWMSYEGIKKNQEVAQVLGGLGCAVAGAGALFCAHKCALVWFAPKVYLMQQLADMMK